MKWEKRECPVKISLKPGGAGSEEVEMDLDGNGIRHSYRVSGVRGHGFWALVESLYALWPGREDSLPVLLGEGRFVDDGVAEFFWDGEGSGVSWRLTRLEAEGKELRLAVELAEWTGDDVPEKPETTARYEVPYADLCLAVGKAVTEALKAHGFGGFRASVWESDVNVRQVCFLKACGLGQPDFLEPTCPEGQDAPVTSFADELELLLFDL